MGLLGNGFDDPQSAAIMGLAAGLMHRDFGGGLLAANDAYAQAKQNAFKQQLGLLQMQQAQQGLQKGQLELDEYARKTKDADAARQVLADFYKNQGMPQTAPMAPAMPGQLGIGSFGAMQPPMGQPAIPAQTSVTPKAAVWQQYKTLGDTLAAKGLVDQAQQYYGLAEKMRPKFGTEPRVMMGPDGKLVNVLVGEDGTTQVLPFGVKPAIKMQDLGGKVVAVDENSLQNGQTFGKTMTPGEIASNQLGWANNAATLRGQNLTDARAREANATAKIPAGYRQTADGGLEYIPGGPADPNSAKRAAPTEFQGKSTTFAARMQDAAKVLDELESKVNPSQVAQAGYKPSFPGWIPGGQIASAGIEAANRLITPDDAQRYRQAQENWVTANLRQESGAAIGKEEMEKDVRKWFPQPGEPASVIAQKAAARKVAERAMLVQAGPGASSIPGIVDGGMPTQTAPTSSGGADWKYINGKLVRVK